MKTKVLIVVLLGLGLLTWAHISLNVGWDNVKANLGVVADAGHYDLKVGFLPVT